jgi:NAD(P)-dependent dehydrogenase (short-subunit alcohol dehydrogenase family)
MVEAGVPKERIHSVKGDITDPAIQKTLIDETVKTYGKIDVLINNAGGVKTDEKDQRSMESLDYCLNVNLKAAIALTELAIPHLEKTKGNIINVSSGASQKPFPSIPFYCISKAALDHFARNYAAILAPQGIRINNLNPGLTDTGSAKKTGVPQEIADKMRNFYISQIPLHRAAASEEMAEFMAFMASEKASYMTGQCINVDGGMLINSSTFKFD